MAAQKGRDLLVLKNAVAIAGLRETSVAHGGSPIDITSKSDSGARTLASFSGTETIDISGSGVFDDDTIRNIAFGGPTVSKLLTDITLEWGDGSTMSGDFYLASFTSAGSHGGEETYDIALQSSDVWTHTPAA